MGGWGEARWVAVCRPQAGCRQGGATGQSGGLTRLVPTTGPEASSVEPPRRGFMSVPWRAIQQPPFTRRWCPGSPGRQAMVPGSARFSPVAPGDRDCYFPPFMEKQTEACRGREPRWWYQGYQGAGTAGTQTQGPRSTGCPAVSQLQWPNAALPRCLCVHSLSPAERGRRQESGTALPGLP